MEYISHFKTVDKTMSKLIDLFGPIHYMAKYKEGKEYFFENLITSIIGQQLSLKAAETIKNRVFNYLNYKVVPISFINAEIDELRKCGMSNSKINYVKNLSIALNNGDLSLEKIDNLSDREVIKELTKVKGIGEWTAEMFLIFSLRRPDVFSFSDVGLANAIKKLYGEDLGKEEIYNITNNWKPFRSYASMYLWKSLD